ncbi:T9SS type A sorting domain-containing protein [Oscillatoria amoena NRMC-F 0135]|nr:T9SS type A sorting domain-containing protein [Oscillatoria amoena NRMC-F 0135]
MLIILAFVTMPGWGQLTITPIAKPGTGTSARKQSLPAMALPFWDDFSTPANTDTLWDNYSTVWINSDLGINPPTIEVCSFDGLSELGLPYNLIDMQAFGYTDSLVSRKISMASVPLALRNTVFFSFYYQWGGFGETPDPNDFLSLEFKTNTGVWETIAVLTSDDTQQPDAFYDTLIRINQDRFFHNDFQFRFRSFGRQSGRYDTWHIDYVYLNVNRNEFDTFYPDRAVFKHIGSPLGPFYAVPYRHFTDPVTNPTFTNPSVGLYNLSVNSQPMNFDSFFKLHVFENGTPTISSGPLSDSVPSSLASLERKFFSVPVLPPKALFSPSADSAFLKLYLRVNTRDTLVSKPDFQLNDSSFVNTQFDDYYAYDDGSADYAAGLTQAGNLAAYRFVLKNSGQDTLNGGYIHYPYTGSASPNIVTLMIWSSNNGVPGSLLTEQTIPVRREANSKFTEFTLNPAVIVEDTVFIGWIQGNSGLVRIGLDTSHDTGEQIYVNTTGTWVMNDLVIGSLMIRPRFGTGEIVTGVPEVPSPVVDLYPNPSTGEFYLKGEVTSIEMLSLTGQPVELQTQKLDAETWVRATAPCEGLYLVRYKAGNSVQVKKILIIR